MSFLRFDDDAQQVRMFIPPVKKLPPNPHIGPGSDALLRALAPPSETAGTDSEYTPESPEDKNLRHRLLACDQRSFFTGSASADLQAAHIINPVRRNPERKKLVVSLLFPIAFNVLHLFQEDLLSQQKLQDPSVYKFLLDSPTNAILREYAHPAETSINRRIFLVSKWRRPFISTGISTELFALYHLKATPAPCLRLYARLTKTGQNVTPPKVPFAL